MGFVVFKIREFCGYIMVKQKKLISEKTLCVYTDIRTEKNNYLGDFLRSNMGRANQKGKSNTLDCIPNDFSSNTTMQVETFSTLRAPENLISKMKEILPSVMYENTS